MTPPSLSIFLLISSLLLLLQEMTQIMIPERLSRLRHLMKQKGLSAYLVPSEDAHQSEYTSDCDARRSFISGFTGSAGCAIITNDKAALWTDGRYYTQADRQLSPRHEWTLMKEGLEETPTKEKWLKSVIKSGDRVGVDPKLISFQDFKSLSKKFQDNQLTLSFESENLIDRIWEGRPSRTHNEIQELPMEYAGISSKDKISKLQKYLFENDYSFMIITALDEIAWLFNLRGSDIPFNPLFYSFSIIGTEKVILYANESRLPKNIGTSKGITIKSYENIYEDVSSILLYEIEKNKQKQTQEKLNENNDKISQDSNSFTTANSSIIESINEIDKNNSGDIKILASSSCNSALANIIGKDRITITVSPIEIEKAVKNSIELEGFRNAHIKDGVAVCKYICWLQDKLTENSNKINIQSGEKLEKQEIIDEVDGSEKLLEFRMMEPTCRGASFDTISSVGSNAAVIHYKPEKSTAATINSKEIYLLDSGGQYLGGTTDITRTMHFGTPSEEERENFTRVLRGNLALNMIKFPKRTTGLMLDSLARMYLWQIGLDYRHGTGHGVGHYLNVHEGPHGISMRPSSNEHALKSGMTVTDEPGFYKEGHYGIRIENVLIVKDAKLENNFGNVGFLEFENITLVPIQRKMIKKEMLTRDEIDFLNEYHQECWNKLEPLLRNDQKTLEWLRNAVLPL